MNLNELHAADRIPRRRSVFGRRARRGVFGRAGGYRDPFFADAATVEDDARRLRGPDG